MCYKYTLFDDNEGLDGGPRYEVYDAYEFTVGIVDDEEVASLFSASDDLLYALERLVERERAEAAISGISDDEMTWLAEARAAIANAKGA